MEEENVKSVCGLCQQRSVSKLLVIFLGILCIFFLVKTYGSLKENSFIGQDIYPQTTISVTGEGEMSAVPDIATFSFSVTEEAQTVEEAQTAASKIMSEALTFLKESGVEEKNIKTSGYNIYPQYEWISKEVACYGYNCPTPDRERTLIGYKVSQNILVRLDDIDKAGEVLSGLGSVEVSNLSGLNFEIDDEDELRREAREMAITEAQEKAEVLAKDLGVSLVRMTSYSSNEGNNYPVPMYAEKAVYGMGGDFEDNSVEIPVGENEINIKVYLTYEIK